MSPEPKKRDKEHSAELLQFLNDHKMKVKFLESSNSSIVSSILMEDGQCSGLVVKEIKHDKEGGHILQCDDLENEVKMLNSLKHYSIMELSSDAVSQFQNSCAIFMPKAEGDMFDFMLDYNFNDNLYMVKKCIRQIGEALLFLHDQLGLVHADIKLENIFRFSNNNCKLADFGFCKKFQVYQKRQDFLDRYQLRSLKYLPPEYVECLENKNLNVEFINERSSDVFGLGVALFQLIFKQVPSDIETKIFLRFEKEDKKVNLPSQISQKTAQNSIKQQTNTNLVEKQCNQPSKKRIYFNHYSLNNNHNSSNQCDSIQKQSSSAQTQSLEKEASESTQTKQLSGTVEKVNKTISKKRIIRINFSNKKQQQQLQQQQLQQQKQQQQQLQFQQSLEEQEEKSNISNRGQSEQQSEVVTEERSLENPRFNVKKLLNLKRVNLQVKINNKKDESNNCIEHSQILEVSPSITATKIIKLTLKKDQNKIKIASNNESFPKIKEVKKIKIAIKKKHKGQLNTQQNQDIQDLYHESTEQLPIKQTLKSEIASIELKQSKRFVINKNCQLIIKRQKKILIKKKLLIQSKCQQIEEQAIEFPSQEEPINIGCFSIQDSTRLVNNFNENNLSSKKQLSGRVLNQQNQISKSFNLSPNQIKIEEQRGQPTQLEDGENKNCSYYQSLLIEKLIATTNNNYNNNNSAIKFNSIKKGLLNNSQRDEEEEQKDNEFERTEKKQMKQVGVLESTATTLTESRDTIQMKILQGSEIKSANKQQNIEQEDQQKQKQQLLNNSPTSNMRRDDQYHQQQMRSMEEIQESYGQQQSFFIQCKQSQSHKKDYQNDDIHKNNARMKCHNNNNNNSLMSEGGSMMSNSNNYSQRFQDKDGEIFQSSPRYDSEEDYHDSFFYRNEQQDNSFFTLRRKIEASNHTNESNNNNNNECNFNNKTHQIKLNEEEDHLQPNMNRNGNSQYQSKNRSSQKTRSMNNQLNQYFAQQYQPVSIVEEDQNDIQCSNNDQPDSQRKIQPCSDIYQTNQQASVNGEEGQQQQQQEQQSEQKSQKYYHRQDNAYKWLYSPTELHKFWEFFNKDIEQLLRNNIFTIQQLDELKDLLHKSITPFNYLRLNIREFLKHPFLKM